MKKFTLLLRYLTLASYFLPFVFCMSTCVGDEYRTAYNKKDAFKNISDANRKKIPDLSESAYNAMSLAKNEQEKSFKIDSIKKQMVKELSLPNSANIFDVPVDSLSKGTLFKTAGQNLLLVILIPTYYSYSGIGALFEYKHNYGRVINGLSLALTFLTLILWRFLKRKKIILFVFALNLTCLISILVDSFISDIDLLWGFWMLFILISAQLILEVYEQKKSTMPQP